VQEPQASEVEHGIIRHHRMVECENFSCSR
jgi:hypothetical protein